MRNIEVLGFGASNIRDLMVLHFLHVSLRTIDLKKALSLMTICQWGLTKWYSTLRVNSLAPGKRWQKFWKCYSIVHIEFLHIPCENALIWIPRDIIDAKSTFVQIMAWCRQATSHYLRQCWPRSTPPYGIIRLQWVNSLWPSENICWHQFWSTLVQVMAWCLFRHQTMHKP